jgi:hypothetical protein
MEGAVRSGLNAARELLAARPAAPPGLHPGPDPDTPDEPIALRDTDGLEPA